MNYNIKIALDKIKGAEVRKLTVWTGESVDFICLPINNIVGTVQNARKGEDGKTHAFKHCYLNLEALEVSNQENGTHIVVVGLSMEMMQKYTEEQLRRRKILGNLIPWGWKRKKEE